MNEEKILNYLTLISGVIILCILVLLAPNPYYGATPVEVLVLVLMIIPFIFFGFLFLCGIIRLLIKLLINLIIFIKKWRYKE